MVDNKNGVSNKVTTFFVFSYAREKMKFQFFIFYIYACLNCYLVTLLPFWINNTFYLIKRNVVKVSIHEGFTTSVKVQTDGHASGIDPVQFCLNFCISF